VIQFFLYRYRFNTFENIKRSNVIIFFSARTNDSLPSSKCLSSGDSWGSEEGRQYRRRSLPNSNDENETSSDNKSNYNCKNETSSDYKLNYEVNNETSSDNRLNFISDNETPSDNNLNYNCNSETSSDNKLNYNCNNELSSDNKSNYNSNNERLNSSSLEETSNTINNDNSLTSDANKDNSVTMNDEIDSSLQNTIWKISDCSVYTKPSWTKTSWQEKQIFTQETKVSILIVLFCKHFNQSPILWIFYRNIYKIAKLFINQKSGLILNFKGF
jgi:hypothetical protein